MKKFTLQYYINATNSRDQTYCDQIYDQDYDEAYYVWYRYGVTHRFIGEQDYIPH